MRKKFELVKKSMGLCPKNLTEARKFIENKALGRLEIGCSIEFMGIGNCYNFGIKRVR